jgi:chorismate mutase
VERRIPIFPFSREQRTLKQLHRSLAVYRLAFGQPRQEDLLELLMSRSVEGGAIDIDICRICLEPPEE